jgi:transposase
VQFPTILGAISSQGVVSVEVREPLKSKKIKVAGGKKKKNAPATEKKTTGTTAGHYMRFISKMLNEMDKFPEMENFYIIMDNAPIHKPEDDIDGMIERRGYRSVRLPPYSPELNPIEQFWALLKGKVKRSQFGDAEDLKTRISEASQDIPVNALQSIIRHSSENFQKCLNRDNL